MYRRFHLSSRGDRVHSLDEPLGITYIRWMPFENRADGLTVPVRETPGFARRPAEHHLSDLKFEAVQRHTIA